MAPPRILILGAGFAGIAAATELAPLAAAGGAEVTLVDRSPGFRMGFSMQWVLMGRMSAEEGHRPYSALRAPGVRFVQDEVVAIDTAARTVRARSRDQGYDHLLLALGAEMAPELVPGLAEAAFNLCEMDPVLRMKSALESLDRGTVAVAVSSVPFKCPPAPYEYALLIDDLLRKRGVRDRVRLVVTTPEPQPMPVAGRAVGEQVAGMLAAQGIEFLPGHKPRSIDPAGRRISYENGAELAYDVLGAMYPHRAPKVVREAGLADASGFVPVELGTFRTSAPGVFAVGDIAGLKLPNGNPHPKAGVFAEAQALTAARTIAVEIGGGSPLPYSGKGACFVDVGRDMAAAAEANLLAPGGPQIVLKPPSAEGLEGKRRFQGERFAKWFGG